MIFKPYDCDFGITVDGVSYDYDHFESLQIENPERTRLIRGSNAGDTEGIVYKEGIKEAKVTTLTVIGMPVELYNLHKSVYENRKRIEWYCISRGDGSSMTGKKAILSQEPQQLNIDDTAESMNVALVFECFQIVEIHKS